MIDFETGTGVVASTKNGQKIVHQAGLELFERVGVDDDDG